MKAVKILSLLMAVCMMFAVLSSCNTQEADSSTSATAESSKKTSSTTKATAKPKPEAPKYDEERPEVSAVLPQYAQQGFYISNFALGQKCEMYVAIETNKTEYAEYLQSLEANGYSFYTENQIGENLYSTYVNDTHILNVIFVDAFAQTRVIVDDRSVFTLPSLEADNVYTESESSSLTLLSDKDINWPGRMGYIYQLADGSFFIIDGGYTESGSHGNSSSHCIMAVLEKYAPDSNNIVIAAWLLTHTHEDHIGGFIDMSKDESIRNRTTIEKVIYNTPNKQDLSKQDVTNGVSSVLKWRGELDKAIERWAPEGLVKAHPGQVFYLRNLKLTIYNSQDLLVGAPLTSIPTFLNKLITVHNDTSITAMVEFMSKKTLYLADSSARANGYVLDPVYNTSLQADIVQVAHHGYGDTNADRVYQHITPTMVFWPVCKQHYDGYNEDGSVYYEGGSAYAGVKNVGFNKEYLFKDGIVHYYHGGECVTFSDFETWEGVRWDAVP